VSGHARVPGQPPSRRQLDLLRAYAAYVAQHGVPPTVRELKALLGVASENAVCSLIKALIAKGFMERRAERARGLSLTSPGWWVAGYSPPQPPRLLASGHAQEGTDHANT